MKTDSVTMLIEENNQLREKLNAANKVYYDKILLYMRSTSLFKTDLEIENILDETINLSIISKLLNLNLITETQFYILKEKIKNFY